MSGRLKALARENAKIVATGGYRSPSGRPVDLADALAEALAQTRIYGPESVEPGELGRPADAPGAAARTPTRFEVTGESSTVAARRLAGSPDGSVAVLAFASARNPGGGYVNGAKAQEEALCRASALYETLLTAREFYEVHRAGASTFYTDRVIHSPGVPVFRDDRGRLLEHPFRVSFLTSPAPNAGTVRRAEPDRAPEIPAALVRRAERVLEVAARHGHRRLVLGAWGCGVFRNDPAAVAAAWHTHLTGRFAHAFDHVVFAILDRDPAVRAPFDAAFGTGLGTGLGGPGGVQRQP
ncbi:TIGR02452 family protein [Streptomyces sp. BI20]|uniref:TIGR02452 family protein n=1 Tax=Streptomyces sp. BI20 TaxID=3403460 RepID=UPI003C7252A9